MSAIGGVKRERTALPEFVKRVGLFEAKVVAVNPDVEEYKEVLGMELKEDSKATEYLGTNTDGNAYLRVDVWLEEIKTGHKFVTTFFLEDKERDNKDGTKTQYINTVGTCAWASDENNLPAWFKEGTDKSPAREYRVANNGEEELYNFLRIWLSNLDYRVAETVLQIEWKKILKGNVKDIKDQIEGEWSTNIVAVATVRVKEKDGESKEFQGIYNKAFLPPYSLKYFRLVDYMNSTVLNNLKTKKTRDLKPHEKFVLQVTGEYGCKDFYRLREIQDYNTDDNLVASDKTISSDGADY